MALRPSVLIAIVSFTLCPLGLAASDDYAPTTLVYPPFRHCLGIHRATSFHLFVYLGTRTSFNEPAGIAAVKLVQKDDATTGSDDDELTVLGLNSGECEIIYNTSLYNVQTFGECGSGPGQFRGPLGIAADPRGNVFVADTGNNRIVHLVYEKDALRYVGAFGSTGSGRGEFLRPSQVALGASGTLYVTDTGNDRVIVASGQGEILAEISGDEFAGIALREPTGLAVVEADDPWISRGQDFMVVSDLEGRRLLKVSRSGRVLASVEAGDLPIDGAEFRYLAIDYYGSVYATDTAGSRIHKFDSRLEYVTSVGRHGTGDMELDEPRGIALWRRFGQIFVTEREGAQYFWIGIEILDVSLDPSAFVPGTERVRIEYFLTEVARVTIEVLDERGELVHRLVSHRRRAIGENAQVWDGTRGREKVPVPPGRYLVRVSASPTYSSRKYVQDTVQTHLTILSETDR